MDLKEQANKLIKLAEQIEKEASEYAFFICANCNHTASLKDINERRSKIASQEDPEMTVKPVTVNDTISCPVVGCEGNMTYVATDESDKYYVEAGKEDVPEAEAPESDAPEADAPAEDEVIDEPKKDDAEKKEDTGDIDKQIDDLFEDVETQGEKVKKEKKDKVETIQKARKEKKEDVPADDLLDDGAEKDKSETPKDTEPLVDPAKAEEGAEPEDVPEDKPADKPKPKKKKEPIDLEKKDVPKFKSKEAADRYAQSVSRYSM